MYKIDVSLSDIYSFRDLLEDVQKLFDENAKTIKRAENDLISSYKNFVGELKENINKTNEDLSLCNENLKYNQNVINDLTSEIKKLEDKIAKETNTNIINDCKTQISNKKSTIERATKCNSGLKELISEISYKRGKYIDAYRSLPDVDDAISYSRRSVSNANSKLSTIVDTYKNIVRKAIKVIEKMSRSLASATGYGNSISRNKRIFLDERTIANLASKIRNIKDKMDSLGDNLSRSALSFSLEVNDDVSRSTVDRCKNAIYSVEQDTRNLKDIAYRLEEVVRYLREYYRLRK